MPEPVLDPLEKRNRYISRANLAKWARPHMQQPLIFLAHLRGIDAFNGSVLEIGGADEENLRPLFKGSGAEYLNVRLERNLTGSPYILAKDFMEMGEGDRAAFDLIISNGVFEEGGIDRNRETHSPLFCGADARTNIERLAKLGFLISEGGCCVIGTISAPCIFSESEIIQAGFAILYRRPPFNSFMRFQGEMYHPGDRSELLVLKKHA